MAHRGITVLPGPFPNGPGYEAIVLPTLAYSKKSSIHFEWGESAITFHSHFTFKLFSVSQKCSLNFLGRWPTVVLLLSNAVYKNGHLEPVLLVPTLSAFKRSPVCSRHICCGTHEGHRLPKGKLTWSFHCQSSLVVSATLTCLFIVHYISKAFSQILSYDC